MATRKKSTFPNRKVGRKEVWSKRCANHSGHCGHCYIPDEHEICGYCLISKFMEGECGKATSCCSHGEEGFTANQVAKALRRAIGEVVVYSR